MTKSKIEGIDLIISCGDLAPQYLSFLATFTHAPVLYVHGNHDACYAETPPEGAFVSMIRYMYIKAFGYWDWAAPWEYQYNGAPHQYTEKSDGKTHTENAAENQEKRGL